MNVKTSFGILLCMALTSAGFAQTDTGAQTVEKGYTQPSYRKELAFSFQGIIAKVEPGSNVMDIDITEEGVAQIK